MLTPAKKKRIVLILTFGILLLFTGNLYQFDGEKTVRTREEGTDTKVP